MTVETFFANFGHLADAANGLQKLRGDDLLCRYGGEEFCLLVPTCDAEEGAMIAEKARQRVLEQGSTAVENVLDLCISGSFGVSTLSDNPKNLSEMIEFADRALYDAKENGRNQVVVYKPQQDQPLKVSAGS